MLNAVRQQKILDIVKEKGNATVTRLQQELGVSEMTIRRDLGEMKKNGILRRVYGGAVLPDPDNELSFGDRLVQNRNLKVAIARYAATKIQFGNSIFLDGGTTCSEFADILPEDMNIVVFTNSLEVLNKIRTKKGIIIVSLGGELAFDGNTFDGVVAIENAEKINVDICFFSGSGFNPRGVLNPGMVGTIVKRSMIKNSRFKCLLADSTKFGGHGVIELCRWTDINMLVSDDKLPDNMVNELKSNGVEIKLVESN